MKHCSHCVRIKKNPPPTLLLKTPKPVRHLRGVTRKKIKENVKLEANTPAAMTEPVTPDEYQLSRRRSISPEVQKTKPKLVFVFFGWFFGFCCDINLRHEI
jgi:hypothetical protein